MITKIVHSAFPHPERSRLRKMSLKTMMSNHSQMNQRKNHKNDQKTSPVPKSAPITMICPSMNSCGLSFRDCARTHHHFSSFLADVASSASTHATRLPLPPQGPSVSVNDVVPRRR